MPWKRGGYYSSFIDSFSYQIQDCRFIPRFEIDKLLDGDDKDSLRKTGACLIAPDYAEMKLNRVECPMLNLLFEENRIGYPTRLNFAVFKKCPDKLTPKEIKNKILKYELYNFRKNILPIF